MTKYTDFLKQWASSKDLSYMCARDQPEFKQAWNAQKPAPKARVKAVKPPKPPKAPKQPRPKSVPIRQPKAIPVAKQPKTQKTNPKLPFNNALAERLEELEKPPAPYIPLMSAMPEMDITQKRLQPFTRSIPPPSPVYQPSSPAYRTPRSAIIQPMVSLSPYNWGGKPPPNRPPPVMKMVLPAPLRQRDLPFNLSGSFFRPREQGDKAGYESSSSDDSSEEEEPYHWNFKGDTTIGRRREILLNSYEEAKNQTYIDHNPKPIQQKYDSDSDSSSSGEEEILMDSTYTSPPRQQEYESDSDSGEEEILEGNWIEADGSEYTKKLNEPKVMVRPPTKRPPIPPPVAYYEPLLNIYPSDEIIPKKTFLIRRPPPPQPTVFKQPSKFIEPMPVLNVNEYVQHPDLEEGEIYEEPPSAEEMKALDFQKWKKEHRVAWTNSVFEEEYGHHSTWDMDRWLQYNRSVDSDIQWENGNPAEQFPNQYKKIRKRHQNIQATESEEEEEAEEARKKKQEEEDADDDAFWDNLEKAQDLVERHGEEKAKKMMEKNPELVATHVIKRAYKKKDKDAPPPAPKRAYNWKKAEKNKAFLKDATTLGSPKESTFFTSKNTTIEDIMRDSTGIHIPKKKLKTFDPTSKTKIPFILQFEPTPKKKSKK